MVLELPLMAYENFQRKRIDLFWGCKFKKTLKLYLNNINELIEDDKLESINVCYSQEPKKKKICSGIIGN